MHTQIILILSSTCLGLLPILTEEHTGVGRVRENEYLLRLVCIVIKYIHVYVSNCQAACTHPSQALGAALVILP